MRVLRLVLKAIQANFASVAELGVTPSPGHLVPVSSVGVIWLNAPIH